MALGQGILAGKKTYILAGVAAITAIATYLTGGLDLQSLIEALFAAAGTATLRHGIGN